MLSRLEETNIRPALLGKAEVHPGRRNVNETFPVIQREVIVRLSLELTEYPVIVCLNPSGSRNVDWFEQSIDFVFILQSMGNDVELQWAESPENQIVISQRPE